MDIFKDPRKRHYLNAEGADKPLKSPIPHETLMRARAYRKRRIVDQLIAHDCAAALMYDPVNIRYALDAVNMQVWMLHNASHYAMIFADGTAFDFEYKGSEHNVKGIETITEVRPARNWFYMSGGSRQAERVKIWADEIADMMKTHGRGNRRIAVDRLELLGVDALRERGLVLIDGQPLFEQARVIKSADELTLMRWTIRVTEAGMARVYENSLPGKTENELLAELQFENTRSGGEWLETRLLTCGQRTNPWYQESSDNICQLGDMLAFDTDMIGPYGYCADISRSWTIGHTRMSNTQRELYSAALDQITHNIGVLKSGMSFREFNEKSWRIPERFQPRRYSLAFHGVGMADEWPSVQLHPDFARAYEGTIQEGMVVSVESLIGEEGGRECVKLETQVVITQSGAERLDSFPWEEN